jgi:hypothetical protein
MTDTPDVWEITPHACGVCLGRILVRPANGQARAYRCADCSATGIGRQGQRHPPICACSRGTGKRGIYDARLRCVANDNPGPESPWEIIAEELT